MGQGFSEDHCAGVPQAANAQCILQRLMLGKVRRPVGRGHVEGVDVVLDRDGNAVQRTGILACREGRIGQYRLGQRAFCVDVNEGVDHRVQALDALERRVCQRHGRQLAVAQTLAEFNDRGTEEVARGMGKYGGHDRLTL